VNALHWLDRRRIDLAVVPSATAVHGNALGELADRVSVGCIVTTAAALDRPSARPAVYHAFKRGVRVITAYAGDRIVGVPGAGISVLHPPGRAELRCKLKLPDTTCALRIEAGGRSLLLAAAAGRVLGETLSRSSPTADVAIVGEWPCQGVRAAAVVANRSHRAGAAASTDQDGGVALDWSRDGLEIRGWRSHLSAWYPLSR
jgi:beta-lactamase superfamily II metal-dependent hydrolase